VNPISGGGRAHRPPPLCASGHSDVSVEVILQYLIYVFEHHVSVYQSDTATQYQHGVMKSVRGEILGQ